MEELSYIVQQYAWGKLGTESEVARFKKGSDASFVVNPSGTYAELWMGTHISGPSKLKSSSESLASYLLKNPSLVGFSPKDYPNNDLAFLFKVLSIRTALSIQAHPDKALAKQLFEKNPEIYKDPNHKPEMAIALTNFEAMCGFRPVSEIQHHLSLYPEFANIVGSVDTLSFSQVNDDSSMETKQEAVRSLFHAFMRCEEQLARTTMESLIKRLESVHPSSSLSTIEQLMLRLNADFPHDRGVLCPLLLNYLTLSRGESFFMGANEPHAYISGDCIECMALSDNVVRAGLTPKFKDVDTLMHMLHFKCGKPDSFITPIKLDEHTVLYRPPSDVCAEFEVEMTTIPANAHYCCVLVHTGCLLIVTKGAGSIHCKGHKLDLKEGSVVFLPSDELAEIVASNEGVEFFRAHANMGGAEEVGNRKRSFDAAV